MKLLKGGRRTLTLFLLTTELCVIGPKGEPRPPTADERERMHGFLTGHTEGQDRSESKRKQLLGNSFHCTVVALLLSPVMVSVGYLKETPRLKDLWERTGMCEPGTFPKQRPNPTAFGGGSPASVEGSPSRKKDSFSRVGEIPEEFLAHVEELESTYGLGDTGVDYGLGDAG